MDGMDRVHGFDFDYDSAFYDEIDSVPDFEFLAFVDNRQRNLDCDFEPAASQFVCEAGLVGTFQQTGAQYGMNFHRGCDHFVCDFVYSKGRLVCSGSHEYCISQVLCVSL